MNTNGDRHISRDNYGYTLIELIITMGILVIITTSVAVFTSRITSADTRRAAKIVDSTMDKLRLENMTKKEARYLHIYLYDDAVYINVSTQASSPLSDTDKAKGEKIGGKMNIYYNSSGTETGLTAGESIVISFNRSSGAFNSPYQTIRLEYGSKSSTIHCVKLTGRHYVE